MAKKKKAVTSDHFYDESVESAVASVVVDSEYATASAGQDVDLAEYGQLIDMLENKRTEKNYEWMSDIALPEMASIVLTDAGGWANQYFQTRSFVDVILGDDVEDGVRKSAAVKKLLNNSLNRRELFHYFKYIRGRLINALASRVFAVCWWEQKVESVEDGKTMEYEVLPHDAFGMPVGNGNPNPPAVIEREVPVYKDRVVYDHFNYDIVDPANVFCDSKYSYSIQDKDWVIIRSEKSLQELRAKEKDNGYINLNILKDTEAAEVTETAKASYRDGQDDVRAKKSPVKRWDVLERYGKFWITEKDGEVSPGIGEDGEPVEGAYLAETVIGYAVNGSTKVLIRFQKQMLKDPQGNPYRPLLRGLCYIHPRRDEGLSDGKYLKEIQNAINDTYNLSADRTKLATLPTMIGRKYALQDNDTIYFEPEHVIEVEDPATDIRELQIRDNINGAMQQMGMLAAKMQQVSSVYPTTMGGMPDASTTATAIAGSESRSNLRSNYKSLTYEYTFLVDFYTQILWMTHQFARPETMQKLMGKDALFFNPDEDYTFTPVSSNIEMEANKDRKLQRYQQMMGGLSPFASNPKIFKLLNKLIVRQMELLGDEYSTFKDDLLDETPPPPEGGGGPQAKKAGELPTSNQSGQIQSAEEQMVRAGTEGM